MGAGRKPFPPEKRLRNRVMVAFSDEEFRALEGACGDEPLSAFLRRLVQRTVIRRRRKVR